MRIFIITALLLLAGCGLSPEQRQAIGYGLAAGGQNCQANWQQVQQNLANQNAYWTNYRYQQQQLFLMQQQNMILQQRGMR